MTILKPCPMCSTALTDDNPAFVAAEIQEAAIDWDDFKPSRWNDHKKVGDTFHIRDVGEAEVVAAKFYDGPAGYGYDEFPEGSEFDAYVVLKVGENYYRKTGRGDSYNDITWDGVVLPVKATPKNVTVYEFA